MALALTLPFVEAAESGCQASSPYGLLAGYSPTTNISDFALIDLDVRRLGTTLSSEDSSLALSIYETGGNYSLQSLSTRSKALMYDCTACPLKHYQMYFDYYEDYDYADKWVRAAILQTKAAFTSGQGGADFNVSSSSSARSEAASKGATFLTTWMWSIAMFEEAVNHCDAADSTVALGFWDKGVAYYTGSLEGTDGNSKTGTYGELTYAYAERMCKEFKTCGVVGGSISGGSRVNSEIGTLFFDGQRFLKANQCSPLRALTYTIVQLMTVPLVQSVLRSAYLIGYNQLTADQMDAGRAEAATYAAALLPMLRYCDSTSNRDAAAIVMEQMALSSTSIDFIKVKTAVEQSYPCLGITCGEVGGLVEEGTTDYRTDAAACVDSQQSQTYIEVYTPIAGYSPGGNVVEHNAVDLDQRARENATNFGYDDKTGVGYWYSVGGNSQKSGGKLRTIQGFSTGAKKKMYGGCLKVEKKCADGGEIDDDDKCDNGSQDPICKYPDCQSNIVNDPLYVGIQCYKIYKKYYEYFGDYTYADKWVTSAIEGTLNVYDGGSSAVGRLADFSSVKATAAIRKAAALTGSAFMATWMYTIREYEDAIDDCFDCGDTSRGCNENSADQSIGAWDEGVAFSTGSLEGTEGNSRKKEYGVGFYALAERRCIDFKTCGLFGGKLTGGSQVNHDLLTVHTQGNLRLTRGQCATMRPIVDEIIQLMTVPLVQSTLLYAHMLPRAHALGGAVAEDDATPGYGVAFAATMLPLLRDCDKASGGTTADTLFENMRLADEQGQSPSTSYAAVKAALEVNYDFLGLLCSSIGGIWDVATGQYFRGAYPCGNYPPMCTSSNQTGSPVETCKTCGPAAYYSVGEAYCSPCPPGTEKNDTNEATTCNTPCANEPTTYSVSTCDDMQRTVTYTFANATSCPVGLLPADLKIDCEYLQDDHAAVYAMYVFAVLAMIAYSVMLAAIIWFRHERAVRFAQPLFLYLVAIGGIVSLLPIFLLPGPPSYVQCFVPRAVVMLGFTLTFGCLLLKTYRIYKIHEAAQGLRMLKITNQMMMTRLGLMVVIG